MPQKSGFNLSARGNCNALIATGRGEALSQGRLAVLPRGAVIEVSAALCRKEARVLRAHFACAAAELSIGCVLAAGRSGAVLVAHSAFADLPRSAAHVAAQRGAGAALRGRAADFARTATHVTAYARSAVACTSVGCVDFDATVRYANLRGWIR